MLLFWGLTGLLIVAVFVLILPVLLRPVPAATSDHHLEKRDIFRQQLIEIEQDHQQGVLDTAQFESAKNELKRHMLDVLGKQSVVVSNNTTDKRLALLLVVLLPLTAIFLYLKLGNPAAINMPVMTSDIAGVSEARQHHNMAGDMAPLLDSLKRKLEKTPSDGAGWALLARSYVELGLHAESIPAYEKAMRLMNDDAQLLVDYADALAVVNGHHLAGTPEALVNQALKLEPNHPKALMLAATAAFDKKDYKAAIKIWQKLQQTLPSDSEFLADVNASIHEATVLLGEPIPSPTKEKSVTQASVSGTVTISPTLIDKLNPAATLFVFARAEQGAPMPLAVVRVKGSQLPYTFYLDDSHAIMPDHKLSQASKVVLIARISSSGDAKQQKGDLEGMSEPINVNSRGVEVEINKVIK
jgi:cytochrome c-type biogenesis protein CcmH